MKYEITNAGSLIRQTSILVCACFLFACGSDDDPVQNDSEPSNSPVPSTPVYTVSLSVSGNGTVTTSSLLEVRSGNNIDFSVVAELGWEVSDISGCNGTLNNGTYVVTSINSDCQITALFEIKEYDVQVSVGTGGQVSPDTNQTFAHGQIAEFIIVPSSGYVVSSVSGCNGSLSSDTYSTSALTSSCTVTATFAPLVEHLVSFDIGENGTVSLSNELVSEPQLIISGEAISLVVSPNDGYIIESVTGCEGTLDSSTYETAAITEDCTVTVAYKKATEFTVVPISSKGGALSPSETQIVLENQTIAFEVYNDDDEEYVVSNISGCGGELDGTTYTTAAINEHCYVVVEFIQQSLLNDTGITTCGSFDENKSSDPSLHLDNLDCATQPIPSTSLQNGQDTNGSLVPGGQDAHFGRDAVDSDSVLTKVGAGAGGFDYTRLNNDGTEYTGSGDFETEPWSCVLDNHTGLVWEVKEALNDIRKESERDGDDRYRWHSVDASRYGGYDSTDNYTDQLFDSCHAATFGVASKECFTTQYVERAKRDNICGINTWRLPSVNELHGLVHYGAEQSSNSPSPLIDASYFPNITTKAAYWTRMAVNSYPDITEAAWAVGFVNGTVGSLSVDQFAAVMLVSEEDAVSVPDETESFEIRTAKAKAYGIYRNDFLPLARHEKCINCHEFELRNDIYRTHIQQGRITPSYRDTDCVACHTEATGFVDGWRAPSGANHTNFLTSQATPEIVCAAMNRVNDPAHHLLEDHLILWAVEQFPEISKEDWEILVESMMVASTEKVFSCDQP